MRRVVVVGLMAVLAFGTLPVGPASADTWVAESSVEIDRSPQGTVDKGERVLIFGDVFSNRRACVRDRWVDLHRQLGSNPAPRNDPVVASDFTDAEGEFLFTVFPTQNTRYYARAREKVITRYGHHHTCKPKRSPTLFVPVAES